MTRCHGQGEEIDEGGPRKITGGKDQGIAENKLAMRTSVRAVHGRTNGHSDLVIEEEVQELIRLLERPPPPPYAHPHAPVRLTTPVPARPSPLIGLGIARWRPELRQRQRPHQPAAARRMVRWNRGRRGRLCSRVGGDEPAARVGSDSLEIVEGGGID